MPPKPIKRTQKRVKSTLPGETEVDAKPTEANTEEGATDITQESSSAIPEAIHSLKSDFAVRFDVLLQAINGVQCDLKALTSRVTEAKDQISKQEDNITELQTQNAKLKTTIESLSSKVDDLENRSWRSNLRLVGLSEKKEGKDMCAFLEKWLPEILGPENLPGPLVIERAHRIGRVTEDRSDTPPRAVIMKFLNYADKVRTLKAARAKGTLMEVQEEIQELIELEEKHHEFPTGEKSFELSKTKKRFSLKKPQRRAAKNTFTCSQSGKGFTFKSNLNKHMRVHTGEVAFMCHQCGKSFKTKGNLNMHMKSHTGEKPYICSQCGKCFTYKCNLNEHMRVHTGERPYTCHRCG
ncbi:zinc finger protein 69 homolog [Myxocyprinus asiaticus]|uniref:zinc finger protein 69 homolog n=1 Tax=Myxocyprinus asiaticus TaxID=70543 RepID=UPI002222DF60|nr:zinc finger protein 69 homolog [Myxocyprinus asiaticus]